jgi:hypothetical protein
MEKPGTLTYAAGDTHAFTFSTTDVSMTALMHAMETQTIRWFVSPAGLEISECILSDQITYYANMPAKNFGTSFKCSGPVCIAFNPKSMYLLLKSHQQRDVCTWTFDPKKPTELTISVHSQGVTDVVHHKTLPLHVVDVERYDAEPMDVQYLLAFDSGEIPGVIHAFINIDKFAHWVRIETTPEHITFIHESCSVNARITYRTMGKDNAVETKPLKGSEDTQHRSVAGDNDYNEFVKDTLDEQMVDAKAGDKVSHLYDLWYFQQIIKCFSISRGAVLVFVRYNKPLVFEIKVGTLGKLRVAVLFVPEDEFNERSLI